MLSRTMGVDVITERGVLGARSEVAPLAGRKEESQEGIGVGEKVGISNRGSYAELSERGGMLLRL